MNSLVAFFSFSCKAGVTRRWKWAKNLNLWFYFSSFVNTGKSIAWTFQSGNRLLMNTSLHNSVPGAVFSSQMCQPAWWKETPAWRIHVTPSRAIATLTVSPPWEQAAERWVWWAQFNAPLCKLIISIDHHSGNRTAWLGTVRGGFKSLDKHQTKESPRGIKKQGE